MLKKFILGNKDVPVPLPISTLGDAIQWIDRTFVKDGMVLTSFILDGEPWVDRLSSKDIWDIHLNGESRLEVKIESAQSITVQILQTISELSFVAQRKMLEISVDCWVDRKHSVDLKLAEALDDIKLLLDLVDHMNGIVDYSHEETAAVNGLSHLIRSYHHQALALYRAMDFKNVAHILVNRLIPYLEELATEAGHLQIRIISSSKSRANSPFLQGYDFEQREKNPQL